VRQDPDRTATVQQSLMPVPQGAWRDHLSGMKTLKRSIETTNETEAGTPYLLHLGCGTTAPEGWVNLDGSWNAWLAQRPLLRRAAELLRLIPEQQRRIVWPRGVAHHALRKPLPFPDGSARAVYASHLLEHLYRDEAVRLVQDCFRVIRPRGVLRFVVPDLRRIVEEYMGEFTFRSHPEWAGLPRAEVMNRRLLLRPPSAPRRSWINGLNQAMNDFHSHKWMYDAESLSLLLRECGFVEVAEREFLDSDIPGIEAVEREGRILHGQGVCVEAVRP
jgi:predicted SAM-dependent methyltransferase